MDGLGSLASVSLPRGIEAADLIGLVDQLEARANAVTLPTSGRGPHAPPGVPHVAHLPTGIHVSLTRLVRHRDELRMANTSRDAHAVAPTNESGRTAANLRVDQGWRALESWVVGWINLDDGNAPDVAPLRELHARVFPSDVGLRFIAWRPRKQWEAMVARMAMLTEPSARALIASFGGMRFVAWLEHAHAEFGRAYNFTAAAPADPGGATDTRPQWLAAQDALRDYVRKISAHADPDVADSESLAGYLLGPFNQLVAEFAQRPGPRKAAQPAAGVPEPVT